MCLLASKVPNSYLHLALESVAALASLIIIIFRLVLVLDHFRLCKLILIVWQLAYKTPVSTLEVVGNIRNKYHHPDSLGIDSEHNSVQDA